MKLLFTPKIALLTAVLMSTMLASCAQSVRRPSSLIFTCHFSERIQGVEKHFEFVPDDHALLVDQLDVAFEETDQAVGASVYRTSKKDQEWKGELIYITAGEGPRLFLNLQKSPLTSGPLVLNKACD